MLNLSDEYITLLQPSQTQSGAMFDLSDPDSERTVRMDNLRYDIKTSQVESFFRDYNPEMGSVKFMMNNGMPNRRSVLTIIEEETSPQVKYLASLDIFGKCSKTFIQIRKSFEPMISHIVPLSAKKTTKKARVYI